MVNGNATSLLTMPRNACTKTKAMLIRMTGYKIAVFFRHQHSVLKKPHSSNPVFCERILTHVCFSAVVLGREQNYFFIRGVCHGFKMGSTSVQEKHTNKNAGA
jgi:hypothetical protein